MAFIQLSFAEASHSSTDKCAHKHGPQHQFRLGTPWLSNSPAEKGWWRGWCARAEREPAARADYK